MIEQKPSRRVLAALLVLGGLGAVVLILGFALAGMFGYNIFSFFYGEVKGPYRAAAATADLDGDGDLDVIVGLTRWETDETAWAGVVLWLNQGGGTFVRSAQELPGGFAAAPADLDGDLDTDLVFFDGYTLTPALNQGGGMFSPAPPINPPDAWNGHADLGGSVLLGDLNQDGVLDSISAGCCFGLGGKPDDAAGLIPSLTWVTLNQPAADGWLDSRSASLGPLMGVPVRAAALADVDGDGDLDLYTALGAVTVGSPVGFSDRLFLNDGTGIFSDSGQRLCGLDSTSVALGDVNGDGYPDALVGGSSGAEVWFNQGTADGGTPGVFSYWRTVTDEEPVKAVLLADMDQDGALDALTAAALHVNLWVNDGRGMLIRDAQGFRIAKRDGVAVADFNGDNLPDVFAGADTDAYKVWLNQGNGTWKEVEK